MSGNKDIEGHKEHIQHKRMKEYAPDEDILPKGFPIPKTEERVENKGGEKQRPIFNAGIHGGSKGQHHAGAGGR